MRITKAKKLLLALGLGMGMSASMTAASLESCRTLLYKCDYLGQYQACVDYTRWCGPIP